jgi:hypothetical protein
VVVRANAYGIIYGRDLGLISRRVTTPHEALIVFNNSFLGERRGAADGSIAAPPAPRPAAQVASNCSLGRFLLADMMASDQPRWAKVVKDAGISPE